MNAIVKNFYEKSEGEVNLEWKQIEESSAKIIQEMQKDSFVPDLIISIARSGLIPAALISYSLGNKELYTIKIDFSKTQKIDHHQDMRDKPKISQELSRDIEGKKILVVDEMVVSGETLKLVARYLEMKHPLEVKYAVLYKQPWTQFQPDYCGEEIRAWPIFPWKRLEKK